MRVDQRAAIWNEVWAEYDARQQARAIAEAGANEWDAPVAAAPHPALVPAFAPARPWDGEHGLKAARPQSRSPSQPRPRVRLGVQVAASVVAGLLLVAAWMVLPWLLAVRLSVPMGQGDAPALLRQFDGPAAVASLRAGLVAQVPAEESAGARRFLTGMAERMANSWERPEALRAWLTLRTRGTRAEGAAAPLSNLRSAWPVGLTTFRLEYGPAREAGGVAFDVAWQGDGFRVTGLRFLDAPAVPAVPVAGPLLAMR